MGHLTCPIAQMGVLDKIKHESGVTVDPPGTGLRGQSQILSEIANQDQALQTAPFNIVFAEVPSPFPFYVPLMFFGFPHNRTEAKEKSCLWK